MIINEEIEVVNDNENKVKLDRVFDSSRVLKDNAMLKVRPELFYEWDFEKNDALGLDIYKVTKAGRAIVWWICKVCGESYNMSLSNKNKGKGCKYCAGKAVSSKNSLFAKRFDLSREWHPELNGDLTPKDVTCGEGRVVWWICPKCNESYDMSLNDRTSKKCNCPYCKGRRTGKSNSLQTKNLEIAKQWHPIKNGNLTPSKVTYQSNRAVWWLCDICNHEWESAIKNRRHSNIECPECSKLYNKSPRVANLLLNKSDGNYTVGSNIEVDWKCECGQVIKNKSINLVFNRGLNCPNCSDGKSYPEKFMYSVLRQLEIDFEWEKTFDWSNGKRYDFYADLNEKRILIEVHGAQHYETGFEYLNGRTLKEEQENDEVKYKMAIENSIDEYIVIDARYSIPDFIKNSILESRLTELLDIYKIEWDEVILNAEKSLMVRVNVLWNKGIKDMTKLSKDVGLCKDTVATYLKRGMNNGWNDYCPDEARLNGSKSRRVKIVQLDKDFKSAIYESAREAYLETGIDSSSIISVCRGVRKTAGNFKWMYKEDYDKLISDQKEIS